MTTAKKLRELLAQNKIIVALGAYDAWSAKLIAIEHGVIRSATILGYDDKLYKPTPVDRQYFTVGKYIEKVEQLKKKDLISNGKYEELLMDA